MPVVICVFACLVPLSVFAAFPARTPKWRAARRVYWVTLPLIAGVFAANMLLIDPAGPAAVFYGAWLVFVMVLAAWCYTVGTIRAQWSDWRAAGRPPEANTGGRPWLTSSRTRPR